MMLRNDTNGNKLVSERNVMELYSFTLKRNKITKFRFETQNRTNESMKGIVKQDDFIKRMIFAE